ncbi:MAG: sodium:solute symporter family protein [Desulfobacteria bacterium]
MLLYLARPTRFYFPSLIVLADRLALHKGFNMPPETEAVFRQTNFSVVDWAIVFTYPCISLLIGLYVRKYITSMKSFVAAGQGLGLWLGIATMTGTELGLITVMYSAEKGFKGGFAAFHIALAAGISTLLVGMTGFLVYRLREMEVLTIPEFYGKRFDNKTRILGGIMLALGGILNMGLFLKVGSMFIVGITGLSMSSLALPITMVFLIVLVLIYTCLGGMISVVLSDYVQFVVLSFGLLVASYFALMHVGWENILETIQSEMGATGFDPMVSEGAFGWQYMVWMLFLGLVSCGIWPTAVSRALAMKSPELVKRQYMFASISFTIRFLIPYFWGICAFVFIMQDDSLKTLFYPAGYPAPETLPDGQTALDSIFAMPVFLGKVLPAGVIGIITAGMIAAFMSTHDSYLLCWSSVLSQDVVAPIAETLGRPLSGQARITLSRFFIVAIGLYVLYWGLIYDGDDDIWDYMAITGAIYFTGAFAVLLGGLYWQRASTTGAFLSLLSGLSAIVGLGPVRTKVSELVGMTLTSEGVGLFTVAFSLSVLFFGSLLFPDKHPAPSTTRSNPLSAGTGKAAAALAVAAGVLLFVVARYDAWQLFWTAVLIIGVVLFALLAVVVSIGGAMDVRKLFQSMEIERQEHQAEVDSREA